MKKFKALSWVALYMVIAVAMQVVVAIGIEINLMEMFMSNLDRTVISSRKIADMISDKTMELLSKGSGTLILTVMVDLMMLVGFGLWYYFRENRYPFRPNYRRAFAPKNVGMILVLAICGQFATELIMAGVSALFPWMMEQYEKINDMLQLGHLPTWLMILIVCVVGPIAEEMLFRGMIYGKLRRAFSVWPSVIISSVLFGAFHANWIQGIYASAVGVVMAIIYEETGTIWASCLFHMIFNFSSYVLDSVTKWLAGFDSVAIDAGRFLVDVVSVGIIIYLIRNLRMKRRRVR